MTTSPSRVDLKPGLPSENWVGVSMERFEDARILTGEAHYVADLPLPPRTVHAWFVRSNRAHARVLAIDAGEARALPGVIGVFSAADLGASPLVDPTPYEPKTPQPVLADGVVRFAGEAVALVVADTEEIAEDAAELVHVHYEDLPFVLDVDQAIAPGAPVLHEFLGTNLMYRDVAVFGNVDHAFAAADHIFRHHVHTNRVSPSPLETRGCLADYNPSRGQLTLWSPTQSPDLLRLALAESMGIPSQLVRVVVPDVGGAFGAKIPTSPEEVVVCCVTRLLGRPVRWIESRSDYFAAGTHAKEQEIDIEVAVTSEGRVLAMRGSFTGDAGAYSFNSVSALIEPQRAASMMTSAYDIPACGYEIAVVLTNKSPIAPYRGVGFTAAQTAREVLFDEIARELGIDPVEFRLRNMIDEDSFPYECVTGAVYDSGAYQQGLREALGLVGYDDLRCEQTQLRAEGRYVGIGVSPFVELTGKGSEISTQTGWPFSSHDNATVTIDPSGTVRVAVSVVAQGQGHETALAQIAADAIGVFPHDVQVMTGDTDKIPFGMGTWASRSIVIAGGAIILAARDVRGKALLVASHLLAVDADLLAIRGSRVEVVGDPAKNIPLATVAAAAYWNKAVREELPEPYLSSTRFYDPPSAYASGCLVAVVEVDVETGEVSLRRFAAVEDCGRLVNPAIVEGQMHGAIAQAIGCALSESHRYGKSGCLETLTFAEYRIPRASDVPRLDVSHIEIPSPVTVGGFKGGAEGGMVAGPAAIAAAVADALAPLQSGELTLPLSPEHILLGLGLL